MPDAPAPDDPSPARTFALAEIPDDELACVEMKTCPEDDLPLMGRHPPTD